MLVFSILPGKHGRCEKPLLHINVFVQDCSISIDNALEMLQSCTEPSVCDDSFYYWLTPCHYTDSTRTLWHFKSQTDWRFAQQIVYETTAKSKPTIITFCEDNPPVIDWFPSQRTGKAENASMPWRHHVGYGESNFAMNSTTFTLWSPWPVFSMWPGHPSHQWSPWTPHRSHKTDPLLPIM